MDHLLAVKLEKFWGNAPAVGAGLTSSPQTLLSSILPNVYTFVALIILAYLFFGGFLVITSAGNAQQADKGKTAITHALAGLALVFGSYWLMQVIQILTGIDII